MGLEFSVQACSGPAGAGWPLVAGCCKAAWLLGAGPPGSPSPGNRFRDPALDLQVPKPTVQIPNLTRHDGAAGGMEGGDVGTKDGPNIYMQVAPCNINVRPSFIFQSWQQGKGENIPPSHLHKNWGAELAHKKKLEMRRQTSKPTSVAALVEKLRRRLATPMPPAQV